MLQHFSKLINHCRQWDGMRKLRILLAIGLAIYAIGWADYMFLIPAAWFFIQAAANISCCGAGGCSTTSHSDKPQHKAAEQIMTYQPKK